MSARARFLGGNDCAECTEEQLSRGPQGALTGADPHYVVYLARGVNLCYDVHGTPGDILNLISGKNLLVNSLVVSAPGSVSGTYHGAIGFVATAPSIRGMTTKDVLTVMSDGTVRFNNEMILASSNHSGAEMDLSFVAGKRMIMTMRTTGSSFLVTFVASSRGNAHLDLAVLNQAGLTGTHGIIGQFVNADASVSPKDDKTSILTVNGNTVEVVPRKMPEVRVNIAILLLGGLFFLSLSVFAHRRHRNKMCHGRCYAWMIFERLFTYVMPVPRATFA